MEVFCGECAHLDHSNKERYGNKYYCNYQRKYVELTDKGCYKFMKDPSKCKTKNGSYRPAGCFITTIVCNILGYEDDCELLALLRNFRDNTLKTDPQYLHLLIEYDKIGPLICSGIRCESNRKAFCLGLLKYFLIPCVNAIKEGNNEEAIEMYKNMVIYLTDEFNLPPVIINPEEYYDLETIGKGRIRTSKKSEC